MIFKEKTERWDESYLNIHHYVELASDWKHAFSRRAAAQLRGNVATDKNIWYF